MKWFRRGKHRPKRGRIPVTDLLFVCACEDWSRMVRRLSDRLDKIEALAVA